MKNIFVFKTGKAVLLISLLSLFSSFFVSAEIDTFAVEDVFQVNDLFSYNKPCLNNGTYCSASAQCNYTFYNKDNSLRLNNVAATNIGSNGSSIWQYNLSNSETGIYKVDMVCVDTNAQGGRTLYYQVTGDGNNRSIGFYLLIIGLSFGIILLGFHLSDPWIVIFGTFGLYFVGLYTLFYGIAGMKDATTTWAFGIIILMVAAYISIKSGVEVLFSN